MPEESIHTTSNRKRKRQLNIWIIICSLILIYLIVYFCSYFFGSRRDLYEVVSGTTEGKFHTQYTALALREETVVQAAKSGYINFFVGDATPVHVGEQTYVIDANGELSARLEEASRDTAVLNENELAEIQGSIYEFDTSYNPRNYFDTYNFKYKLESHILDLINNSIFENLNEGISGANSRSYSIVSSQVDGVVQHSIDGFENVTLDNVEASSFRKANYSKQIIKSNDLVEEGANIYKVVTSDEWKLVIQIDDPSLFADVTYLEIEFLMDNIKATCDFQMFTRAGVNYGVLTLDKYMIRYISDRYLQIEILNDTSKGLKIPKTAVLEKLFYMIPVEYKTQGGSSSSYGFMQQVINKDSSSTVQFITPEIATETDEYCYVSCAQLSEGAILIQPETNTQFQVNAKENLQGVMASNTGTFIFKIVNILGENGNYYIVEPSNSYGLRMYDLILADAEEYRKAAE